jgi:hypothetical protein
VPPPRANENVLIVVENGTGPIKYRGGQYGERLYYRDTPTPIVNVAIVAGAETLTESAPAESLYVQATTRGTRQVDYLLAGKANFKKTTGNVAAALGVGAVIAATQKGNSAQIATGVLAGLSLISSLVSAATTPEADIRFWANLPRNIFLLGLTLPAGPVEFQVRGLDPGGRVVQAIPVKTEVVAGDPVQIIFVRFN